MNIFLYGPPGAGKSTLGKALAQALELPFYDLDEVIAAHSGASIPQIFAQEGENSFRQHELSELRAVVAHGPAVVALGGGALLNPQARQLAEAHGQVLCLLADQGTLASRLHATGASRPLLAGDPAGRLQALLEQRGAHYHSFPLRLDTSALTLDEATWQAQLCLGAFRVRGMGAAYDVRIESGGLARLGDHLRVRGLKGPVALVSDSKVGALYIEPAEAALRAAGYAVSGFCFPAGEASKTIETVLTVWDFLARAGVERSSTVVALGGGVVGDLVGFAAATFLRGVPWVNLPTSLLAMIDSSMGGKTGIDLPQAKNLVGAFYPPRLTLADPQVLTSLPERELRGGMGEVVKHGIIADADLYARCAQGWAALPEQLDQIVRQAMAVKLRVIEVDPYEHGLRQALNLGHTIGHGVEIASAFHLSHGEAVAIGTVAEARLAETLGLAETGLAEQISAVLAGLGLPVEIPPELPREHILQAMQLDKKRAAGQVRFALPIRIGEVRTGVVAPDWEKMIWLDQKGDNDPGFTAAWPQPEPTWPA